MPKKTARPRENISYLGLEIDKRIKNKMKSVAADLGYSYLGTAWEDAALCWLKSKGIEINLERNPDGTLQVQELETAK